MKTVKTLFFMQYFFSCVFLFSQTTEDGKYALREDGFLEFKEGWQNSFASQKSFKPLRVDNSKSIFLGWGEPELASGDTLMQSWDPAIAVGPDGTIHVVYNDQRSSYPQQLICYTKKEVGGEWTTPIIVDQFDLEPRNNHVPNVSVSANGDVHICFQWWAYDGTMANMVGYAHWDSDTDQWSNQIISSYNEGSIHISNSLIDIASTENNHVYASWGWDLRTGVPEAYLTYNDGSGWSNDILLSVDDENVAEITKIVQIGDNKSVIFFKEYNIDNYFLKYRLWDEASCTLSDIIETNVNVAGCYAACQISNGNILVFYRTYDEVPIKVMEIDVNTNSITHKTHQSQEDHYPAYFEAAIDDNDNIRLFIGAFYGYFAQFDYDYNAGFSPAEELLAKNSAFDVYGSANGDVNLVYTEEKYGISTWEVFYKKGTPVSGIINGANSNICMGTSSGQMTLTDYDGTIVNWQSKHNDSEWEDIIDQTSEVYETTPEAPGRYRFRVKLDLNGEIFSSVAEVFVDQVPSGGTLDGGAAECCLNDPSGLMTVSDYFGEIQKWQKQINNNGWEDIQYYEASFQEYLTEVGIWEYRVEIGNGVCEATYSNILSKEVKDTPNVNFSFEQNELEVSFINESTNSTEYNWDFGDNIGSSTEENPIYIYQTEGDYLVSLSANNEFCSSEKDSLVQVVLGTNDVEQFSNISLYPNPSNGEFYLNSDAFVSGLFNINIYSLGGRLIKTIVNSKNSKSLKISNIPNGSYIIEVVLNNKSIFSETIIVK